MTAPKFTFESKITLGNAIQIAIILAGGLWGYATLSGSVAASAEAVKAIPGIQVRVSTIETRIDYGQRQREAFQDDTKIILEQLRMQNVSILQAIARLEEAGRRP